MTEVPEHLLKRSRDRRAALGLGGGDAGGEATPAATPATTEASGAPAGAEVAKPAAAAPVEPVAKPPAFVPPYVRASERRRRVPVWVMPVVAFLPIWGVLYAQSLSEAPSKEVSELAAGAGVFTGKQCSGCHGATGGGGAGRPLANGEVLKTFPNIADQLEFVQLGTQGFSGKPYGNPNRDGGPHVAGTFGGAMPAFHGNLTEKELLEVVRHERETLSGEKDIKVDAKGSRNWPNGKPMLDSAGKLVWDDGTPMFDGTGHLTKQVDASKPAS